ncbi:phospholipid-binding protein MlaC [Massilia sp. TS11]|uniref:MlaC/ttg2D family ABC transporter substrate-binding protein n=1 Tax=Massilia sp. TS11 TaxID=2908003 RepID=UPI001EDB4274|nr:ABC transporter substrate-binding protein [Massilia sp. TS11]MCG2585117.1 ABC transporter substrate-binding protein [Massilia sp. TS11]
MKQLKLWIAAAALALGSNAFAQTEAADAFVKRISNEVMSAAKADKDIQAGNQKKVNELVEAKVLPFVDFQRMTSLAAGRNWKDASPEQQKALTNEFRTLLVRTYSGAISQIKDQTVEFKPLRADPADSEVEVRSQVVVPRGEPIQLNYRVAKTAGAWKIYDINVLGAWLVEAYKGTFQSEITKGGFDGLIKALAEKNKQAAAKAAAGGKASK